MRRFGFNGRESGRASAVAALLVASALWCRAGFAEPKRARAGSATTQSNSSAAELFRVGRVAYDSGDYVAAVSAFQASYQLSKKPSLLFNIAQALRLAARCEESLGYYDEYRAAIGSELPSDFDDLRSQAERCAEQQRPAEHAASATTGATLVPSDAALSPATPAPSAAPAGASAPALSATPSNSPAPVAKANQALATASAGAGLEPKAGSSHAAAPSAQAHSGWSGARWIGASSLAVGIGTGAASALLALNAAKAADRTTTASRLGGSWDVPAAENERSGQTSATWSRAMLATSALTSGLGLWLLLRSESPSGTQVALLPTSGGAALDFRSMF